MLSKNFPRVIVAAAAVLEQCFLCAAVRGIPSTQVLAAFNETLSLTGQMVANDIDFTDGLTLNVFTPENRTMTVTQNFSPLTGRYVTGDANGGLFRAVSPYSWIVQTDNQASDLIATLNLPYDSAVLASYQIDPANTYVAKLSSDNESWVLGEQITVNKYIFKSQVSHLNTIDGEYRLIGRIDPTITGANFADFGGTDVSFLAGGRQDVEYIDGLRLSVLSNTNLTMSVDLGNTVSPGSIPQGMQSLYSFAYIINTTVINALDLPQPAISSGGSPPSFAQPSIVNVSPEASILAPLPTSIAAVSSAVSASPETSVVAISVASVASLETTTFQATSPTSIAAAVNGLPETTPVAAQASSVTSIAVAVTGSPETSTTIAQVSSPTSIAAAVNGSPESSIVSSVQVAETTATVAAAAQSSVVVTATIVNTIATSVFTSVVTSTLNPAATAVQGAFGGNFPEGGYPFFNGGVGGGAGRPKSMPHGKRFGRFARQLVTTATAQSQYSAAPTTTIQMFASGAASSSMPTSVLGFVGFNSSSPSSTTANAAAALSATPVFSNQTAAVSAPTATPTVVQGAVQEATIAFPINMNLLTALAGSATNTSAAVQDSAQSTLGISSSDAADALLRSVALRIARRDVGATDATFAAIDTSGNVTLSISSGKLVVQGLSALDGEYVIFVPLTSASSASASGGSAVNGSVVTSNSTGATSSQGAKSGFEMNSGAMSTSASVWSVALGVATMGVMMIFGLI